MTLNEIIKMVNDDRQTEIEEHHKKIFNPVSNNYNKNLDTKDLTNHLRKNIEVVLKILQHANDVDLIKNKNQDDVIYLSILHLVDCLSLIEEHQIRCDIEVMQDLFKKYDGRF